MRQRERRDCDARGVAVKVTNVYWVNYSKTAKEL